MKQYCPLIVEETLKICFISTYSSLSSSRSKLLSFSVYGLIFFYYLIVDKNVFSISDRTYSFVPHIVHLPFFACDQSTL